MRKKGRPHHFKVTCVCQLLDSKEAILIPLPSAFTSRLIEHMQEDVATEHMHRGIGLRTTLKIIEIANNKDMIEFELDPYCNRMLHSE